MKKIALLLCAVMFFSACNSLNAPTETAVSVTTAPEIKVEGLDIAYEGDKIYVRIPSDYTDENIGSYFVKLTGVIYEPHEDSMFCVYRGALYNKDMTRLYAVPYECEDEYSERSVDPDGNPAKVFTVPKTVTWIAPNAFFNRTETKPLKNIYIYSGITKENISELILWGGTFVTRLDD